MFVGQTKLSRDVQDYQTIGFENVKPTGIPPREQKIYAGIALAILGMGVIFAGHALGFSNVFKALTGSVGGVPILGLVAIGVSGAAGAAGLYVHNHNKRVERHERTEQERSNLVDKQVSDDVGGKVSLREIIGAQIPSGHQIPPKVLDYMVQNEIYKISDFVEDCRQGKVGEQTLNSIFDAEGKTLPAGIQQYLREVDAAN